MRIFGIWVLTGLLGLMGYDAFERRARNLRGAAPADQQEPAQDTGGTVQAMEDGTAEPGPPR